MNVGLLAHSALWIEHEDVRLLLDPWLQGTCYDGAWAPAPERARLLDSIERPSHIGFSHAHADHFHLPTLRAIREQWGGEVPCLVPRQIVDTMSPALRRLGFADVRDVPLERPHRLGPSSTISFHACRADDSAQIIRVGRHTLVNANDCKLEGGLLRHLCRLAQHPAFYFGQFSLADGYPFCFDGLSADELRAAAREPLDQFVTQARAFNATWSVPTASFVKFSHPDNMWLNAYHNRPDDVARSFTRDRLSVWYPGDGWCETRGFLRDEDHRRAYEEAIASAADVPLASQGAPTMGDEMREAAERRFAHMFEALPRWLRRRMAGLGFFAPDAGLSFLVDWQACRLLWSDAPPSVPYYSVHSSHLERVCRNDWGWITLHIGCRFRAYNWQQSDAIEMFMPVSTLYALGYFNQPWTHFLRSSVMGVLWERRREVSDIVGRYIARRTWSETPVRRL